MRFTPGFNLGMGNPLIGPEIILFVIYVLQKYTGGEIYLVWFSLS